MNYKKFSDLDSVNTISDNDLFAISSTQAGNGEMTSNKVTFSQLRDQLDYDFDVVEVKEVVPPAQDDGTVYILINGYRVAATRAKEEIRAVYPTHMPRIIPVTTGFRAVKGRQYTIPFTSNNLSLSQLSVVADTNHFSKLEVTKLDDQSGYISLVTTFDNIGDISSIVTITDEASSVTGSIVVGHSKTVAAILNTAARVSNNLINLSYRRDDNASANAVNHGVIAPQLALSNEVKHRINYASDYFNQAVLSRIGAGYAEFMPSIVLEEPFVGTLDIRLYDLNGGSTSTVTVNVNYQG